MATLWSEKDRECLDGDSKDRGLTTTWKKLCGPALNAVDIS